MILTLWTTIIIPLLLTVIIIISSSSYAFVIPISIVSSSSSRQQQRQYFDNNNERYRRRRHIISINNSNSNSNDSKDNNIDTAAATTALLSSDTTTKAAGLSPHSFAGMVERTLIDKFSSIDRIIESWRLLDAGYEHNEFVGQHQLPPISSVKDSQCHQHAHSYVPGLRPIQFYNIQDHSWCTELQKKKNYSVIKKEFDSVLSELENVWRGALTDEATSYGKGWKTLVLMDRGIWDPVNVADLFPKTSTILKNLQIPATEIFFASMEPKSKIEAHSDFTNFVVTSHLGIDIPDNDCCSLTIGDETRQWENGKVMLFDTSILHEAVNNSPTQTRYILMMRVWHPDLTLEERQALQFIYDSLSVPELVNPDPSIRFRAELELQAMKAFPNLQNNNKGMAVQANNGGGGGFSSSSSSNAKKKKKKKKKTKK